MNLIINRKLIEIFGSIQDRANVPLSIKQTSIFQKCPYLVGSILFRKEQ